MDTTQYILLPDGTYAAVVRSMTYGEIVIVLLLVPILVVMLYMVWTGPGRLPLERTTRVKRSRSAPAASSPEEPKP